MDTGANKGTNSNETVVSDIGILKIITAIWLYKDMLVRQNSGTGSNETTRSYMNAFAVQFIQPYTVFYYGVF